MGLTLLVGILVGREHVVRDAQPIYILKTRLFTMGIQILPDFPYLGRTKFIYGILSHPKTLLTFRRVKSSHYEELFFL